MDDAVERKTAKTRSQVPGDSQNPANRNPIGQMINYLRTENRPKDADWEREMQAILSLKMPNVQVKLAARQISAKELLFLAPSRRPGTRPPGAAT